jgi:hypothetical protein
MMDAIHPNTYRATVVYNGHVPDLWEADRVISTILKPITGRRLKKRRLVLSPEHNEDADGFDVLCTLRRMNAPEKVVRRFAKELIQKWIIRYGGIRRSDED